jgi:hypothetical protein
MEGSAPIFMMLRSGSMSRFRTYATRFEFPRTGLGLGFPRSNMPDGGISSHLYDAPEWFNEQVQDLCGEVLITEDWFGV